MIRSTKMRQTLLEKKAALLALIADVVALDKPPKSARKYVTLARQERNMAA